jgi:hypothetical protein
MTNWRYGKVDFQRDFAAITGVKSMPFATFFPTARLVLMSGPGAQP